MGITREELQQPSFAVMEMLQFPELHEESIAELAFHKHLINLLQTCGVHDFTLNDIYKPVASKTRRNLSAVINFAKFREERLFHYEELCNQTAAFGTAQQEADARNAEIKLKLRKLREEVESSRPLISNLKEEASKLEDKLADLNRTQASTHAEIKSSKASLKEMADQLSAVKFQILSAHQDSTRLEGQIVKSPRKLTQALVELNREINELKESNSEGEARLIDLSERIEGLTALDKTLGVCNQALEELDQEQTKYDQAINEIESLSAAVKEKEKTIEELKGAEETYEAQVKASQEKLQRLESVKTEKIKATELAMEAAMERLKHVEKSKVEESRKQTENIMLLQRAERKYQTLVESHNAEVASLRQHLKELEIEVSEYNKVLKEALR
eukprot:TRINITY_DN6067_c0_g1_i1.p1 TRINITY_DN6067_c0_g1~~TRINITY_DN6067_c0_g1_i1.p1  ORF type:complete len:388 (-),score=87.78 TRINITY_DN6067_c0_g1_i1:46-1209(-)